MEQMTPEETRKYKRAEFNRRFGRYWLVYIGLGFTALLSICAGILMPFSPNDKGEIIVTFGGIFAALYYASGFALTGEGAFYYWFGLLTDHDKDNTIQAVISWLMIVLSVITSLTTALAAGSFIAYWLGIFDAFFIMPEWAQEWVVFAIPVMIIIHVVSGTAFKAFSDEAVYERDAKSVINAAKAGATKARADARAAYWKEHATEQAKKLGELEAQEEIDRYTVKLRSGANRPMISYAKDVEADPTNGRK